MTEAVLTVAQMREAERSAMAAGASEWDLMRRAGEGAADYVARVAAGRSITVLCGPGNNGGDGYVIAESLRRRGNPVVVVAPNDAKTVSAQKAAGFWQGQTVRDAEGVSGDVLVDALFGYGLKRELDEPISNLLELLFANHSFFVAIDVPSMVFSDSGEIAGKSTRYDLTLALGAWKPAHFTMPAMAMMGKKRLVSLGLDLADAAMWASRPPALSPPAVDAHKYRRGLLAIVAGAMPGAPLLAAQAAMRAGAGYVKLVSDRSHPDLPAELVIESDLSAVLGDQRVAAFLIGPGLGRTEEARDLLRQVLRAGRPTVVDADALHLLDPALVAGMTTRSLCLTPHEGELAALAKSFDLATDSKLAMAKSLHDRTGMTILAKGPDTVLVGQQGVRFFPQGSSWLSAAGTGDVLAGTIGSRLAVTGDVFRAAEEAVWLHHEAARRAGPAFTAGELALAIKPAFGKYL